MQLEDYFNFLAPDDIRLQGSRIGIETILYEYLHRSQTPEEIADRFRTLTLEQVYATILYYLHNKEAVTAYLEDWLEYGRRARAEQQRNPTPGMLRMSKIKAALDEAERRNPTPGGWGASQVQAAIKAVEEKERAEARGDAKLLVG